MLIWKITMTLLIIYSVGYLSDMLERRIARG